MKHLESFAADRRRFLTKSAAVGGLAVLPTTSVIADVDLTLMSKTPPKADNRGVSFSASVNGCKCDGVTDDAAAAQTIVLAHQQLVIDQTLRLATESEFTVPITILQGRQIIVDGVEVKFVGPVIADGLSHRFRCVNGGFVTFARGSIDHCFPQWWGAKGDGVTDDTAAIQAAIDAVSAGGTVKFPTPSSFYLVTPTGRNRPTGAQNIAVVLKGSHVNLVGSGSEGCAIKTKSPAGTILHLQGTASAYGNHNKVKFLTFGRTVAPTIGSNCVGIQAEYQVWLEMEDVISLNSVIQFSHYNNQSGYFHRLEAFRTFAARGPEDTFVGFQIRGANYTACWHNCHSLADASDSQYAYLGGGKGFDIGGVDMRDLWFRECVADLSDIGYFVDGSRTDSEGEKLNWDIRFSSCSTDSFKIAGFQISDVQGFGMVSILDPWTNAGGTRNGAKPTKSYGIMSNRVSGLCISGGQFFGAANFRDHVGILATHADGHVISGSSHFHEMSQAVVFSGKNGYAFNNCINSFVVSNQNRQYTAVAGITLYAANNNIVSGGSFVGKTVINESSRYDASMMFGILVDAESSGNRFLANTFALEVITTSIKNLYAGLAKNRSFMNSGADDF